MKMWQQRACSRHSSRGTRSSWLWARVLVECSKCGPSGNYPRAHLNAPRKLARSDSDPCGAWCPDLLQVLSVSERLTDSNKTWRQVRKVPLSDMARLLPLRDGNGQVW